MAIVSVEVLHAADTEKTSTTLRKRLTYRVAVNSQLDGPDAITGSALIPQIDSPAGYIAPYKYGNDNDNTKLICRTISNLRKVVNWNGSLSVWQLEAEFLYDRDQNPVDRGVKVTPITRTESEVVEFAQFKGWYKPKSGEIGSTGNLIVDGDINEGNSKAMKLEEIGPVTNSAGTPVVPAPERPKGQAGLIVNWLRYSAVEVADLLGSVNSSQVGISDSHGDFDVDYARGKLLLVDYRQDPVDIFGVRYLDTTAELWVIDDENDHFELDRGLSEYVDVGDDDGKGGTYESTIDLPSNNMRPLLGADGQPISQPVPFDGKGKSIEKFEPNKARYLRWKVNPFKNFSILKIGDHD
jgi:hypothetical protein